MAMMDSRVEDQTEAATGRNRRVAITYDAFISYSHAKDKSIATALQSVAQKLGKPWYHRRALRLFRDDTSLSATPHLWPSIEHALSQSRFLILLASPQAAVSRWVGQEISYWLGHNDPDTVLIALTEGQLDWDEATGDFRWSDATPLPTALRNRFAAEPRWIDLRPYREVSVPRGFEFEGLAADFAAAIRRIPKEDLLSQEVRQQRRVMTLTWAAVTALIVLLAATAWQWQETRRQRNEAQFQRNKARVQLVAARARRAEAEASTPDDIARAAALGLASIALAREKHLPTEADAIEAARNALNRLPLEILSYGGPSGYPLWSLAALPDGGVASGGSDGKVKLWPRGGMGEPVVLVHEKKRNDDVRGLAVLPDGRLASGDTDGTIKLWPKDGIGVPAVLSHGYPVTSLVVLADGRLASAGFDFKIKIWPKEGVGDPLVLIHGGAPARSLVALADGRLASAGDDGNIKIWPKEGTGDPLVLSHGSPISSLALLPD
jgi:hypothetical protein